MADSDDYIPRVSKEAKYSVISLKSKKQIFECHICKKHLCSKNSVFNHLHVTHGMSPLERKKKKYLVDASAEIPRTTLYRRRLLGAGQPACALEEVFHDGTSGASAESIFKHTNQISEVQTDHLLALSQRNNAANELEGFTTDATDSDMAHTYCTDMLFTAETALTEQQENLRLLAIPWELKMDVCDGPIDKKILEHNSGDEDSEHGMTLSDVSTDCVSSSDGWSDDESITSISSSSDDELSMPNNAKANQKELTILSCLLRNNLSRSASRDILSTIQDLFPDSPHVQEILNYDRMWKLVDPGYAKEIHYCEVCGKTFPDNPNEVNCNAAQCNGYRYKTCQTRNNSKQSRASFVFADIKKQIINLLQSEGIWEDIERNKSRSIKRRKEIPDVLTDITDGSVYKDLYGSGKFLGNVNNTNITLTMNTDGVSLYSSSKVQLWPIFLAINELSPKLRFSRDNLILAGIWQGKGKAPFKSYLESFCSEMNQLYEEGIFCILDGEMAVVKLSTICLTCDLPAKAAVLNMRQYNGKNSCIACTDPGKSVKQGKGNAMCYPYRRQNDRYPKRNLPDVVIAMEGSTAEKIIDGFKGISPLRGLKGFNFVNGTPPDYMHGVLLGVTKTLMYKWFSSTQSKKEYFVGNKLKRISARLDCVKPPECMERLPRNLEKNYSHFKATEHQAWLIYYSLPCLTGLLPNKYLNHFSLFSEGVFILLGDHIEEQQLKRAENLLATFFEQFTSLYSEGSCGLNVHNIGSHLVEYVRMLGPLWCWSCFAFEDCNSMLIKSVHGTGNVCHQVMKLREGQAVLRNNLQSKSSNVRMWKNVDEASNCHIAGGFSNINADEITSDILSQIGVNHISAVQKVLRVVVNGKRMYSSCYSRMKKHNCHTFLTSDGHALSIEYFLIRITDRVVHAVGHMLLERCASPLNSLTGGKHLLNVEYGSKHQAVLVTDLVESLWFIDAKEYLFTSRMVNQHGHSVFK